MKCEGALFVTLNETDFHVPEIVICEFMDEAVAADLARAFDVLYDAALVDDPAALKQALPAARALIVRNRTRVDGALLDAAPRLEVIGRLGVGLDNIDLAACAARGIPVCPATGANAVAVAEYVIAGIFMLRRDAYFASDAVLRGDWPRTDLIGGEVRDCRLGLVGFGAIARAVAERARPLGMAVAAYDPLLDAQDPAWDALGVPSKPLDDLLRDSDVISLHTPLTEATRHLIDGAKLALMPRHAILINAARGGIVDEAALAAALRAGALGGAMLDVFETEPLPAGSGLQGVPNLILTPHIAGLTHESAKAVSAVTAANVRRVLTGG